nr:MAG TPA: hypothetical protein [Caudoviricetes sp.]
MATEEVDITSYRFFLFFFCVIYGLVPSDIRSAPPRNFLCGIYRLDKWHSSKKEPLSELLYTNNPN